MPGKSLHDSKFRLYAKYEEWIRETGRPAHYARGMRANAEFARRNLAGAPEIFSDESAERFEDLAEAVAGSPAWREKDERGHRMYSRSLSAYREFLKEVCGRG